MLDSYVFITLGIFSSWLIWTSFLLYITLTEDKSFVYIIYKKKQLFRYWLFIAIIIIISFYLFFIRTQNIGRVVNIKVLWANIVEIIELLPYDTLIILSLVVIFWLIFAILLMRLIYKNIYMRLLALYLYYYQYEFFWDKLVGGQVYFIGDFYSYLIRRVMIFTKKDFYVRLAAIIWPRSFFLFEPRICKIIIPYLVIFDFITQDGVLSKVFLVIPWFYLYMLFRTVWITFHNFHKSENTDFSEAVYKKFLINGKIHRIAILPDPKNFQTKIK